MKNLTAEKAKKWIIAALVRAVKTVAQTAVAMIPLQATISAVDWTLVVSTSLLAGVVSLLTSLAGLPEVTESEDVNDGTQD